MAGLIWAGVAVASPDAALAAVTLAGPVTLAQELATAPANPSGTYSSTLDESLDSSSTYFAEQPAVGSSNSLTIANASGYALLILNAHSGDTLQAGTTYSDSGTTTPPAGSIVWLNSISCYGLHWSATLHVISSTTDGSGTLTSLAADYSLTCTTAAGAFIRQGIGSLRWAAPSDTYSVAGILPSYVAPDAVPTGGSVDVVLPVGILGADSQTLGTAVLGNYNDSRISLVGSTCDGATISSSSPCAVTVHFDASGVVGYAAVHVTIPRTGLPSLELVRTFVQRDPLSAPAATAFPAVGGIGLQWSATQYPGDTVAVFRRDTAADPWIELASGLVIPASGARADYADTSALPGATYDYGMQVQSGDGAYTSPMSVVTATRELSDPTLDPNIAIAASWWPSADPSGRHFVSATPTDATPFYESQANGVYVFGFHTTGSIYDTVMAELPLLPGPGTYLASGPSYVLAYGTNGYCNAASGTLTVRSVLYNDDGSLAELDASLRTPCTSGYFASAEFRINSANALGLPFVASSPVTVSTLVGQTSPQTPVTIADDGPGDLTLGSPVLSGPGAAAWTVQPCISSTVTAGQTCDLQVSFTGAPTLGSSSASLTIPVNVAGIVEPDIVVPLIGRTTATAGAPTNAMTSLLPGGADLVTWQAPTSDGGFPVTSYLIERSPTGTGSWTTIDPGLTPRAGTMQLVDPSPPAGGADYRITPFTFLGEGSPAVVGPPISPMKVDVVVGTPTEATSGTAWGLYLRDELSSQLVPLQVDYHEHDGATVSATGKYIVYARAATIGNGQHDYGLWVIGTKPGSVPRQLTSFSLGATYDPEISPDMSQVSFTYYADPGAVPQVFTIPFAGGTPTLRVTGFSHASWLSPTKLVVENDASASSPLAYMPISGATTGALSDIAGTEGGLSPTVSPDGKTIAFATDTGAMGFYSVASHAVTKVAPPGPYESASYPEWTADGGTAWQCYDPYVGLCPAIRYSAGVGSLDSVAMEAAGVPPADKTAPVIGALSASYFKPGAVIRFSVTDAGSPRGGVVVRCQVGTKPAVSCNSGFSTAGLPVAGYTLKITATDPSGNVATASRAFRLDQIQPTVPTVSSPTYTLSGSFVATFKATDNFSSVVYDVIAKPWALGKNAPGSGTYVAHNTTATSLKLTVAPGTQTCFEVRAIDVATNMSNWSNFRCVGSPLDDKSLRRLDTGWITVSSTAYYGGTAVATSSAGKRLGVSVTVTAKSIIVLGVRCPTCGSVGVYLGGVLVGTVNFLGAASTKPIAISTPVFTIKTGALVLKTLSTKPVKIDAVVVRDW